MVSHARRVALALVVGGVFLPPIGPASGSASADSPRLCLGRIATIVGTAHRDVLRGTRGDDVIAALGGDDTVRGRGGDDVICGSDGIDQLSGGGGDDRLSGGIGGDRLWGGTGENRLMGGFPRTTEPGTSISLLDRVGYGWSAGAVRVDLAKGTAAAARLSDQLEGVEYVRGSPFDDTLLAGPRAGFARRRQR